MVAQATGEMMTSPKRTHPYNGVYPIAPTPFHEDETIDLEGQKRVLDCMIDQKVDGICILANYSEQFLLIEDALKDIEDIQEELKESRHNATNISRLQKDVERLLNELEKLKDKVRENGNHS